MRTKVMIGRLGDSRVARYAGYVHGRSGTMLSYVPMQIGMNKALRVGMDSGGFCDGYTLIVPK